MELHVDHIVLWVEDPLRSLEFYESVVGLPGVRAEEFRAGKVPFPSVRVGPDTIFDLMARRMAPMLDMRAKDTPAAKSAGHPVHHVCLAMTKDEFDVLRARLDAAGVDTSQTLTQSFGARGISPLTFYFCDPDGNVLEARYY